MARIVSSSDEDLALAAGHLRQGLLVALPTETVYGLGANALDGEACKRIFTVKGRPPTDPLIVHVPTADLAYPLWQLTDTSRRIIEVLSTLWPGPLTLVAQAADSVPVPVTGGSGFVGCRVPNHPVAQRLLRAAGCPVAAPSANTFGHVSPTTAQHVMEDLALRDPSLVVVDGGSCSLGIESTVVKVKAEGELEVLRRGCVGVEDLLRTLRAGHLEDVKVSVRDTRRKLTPVPSGAPTTGTTTRGHAEDHSLPLDGPGQLLTHYAPSVPAFLIGPSPPLTVFAHQPWKITPMSKDANWADTAAVDCSRTIVIDFAGVLAALQPCALAYRSLSATATPTEASSAVFELLRWCETIDGAEAVVFPLVWEWWEAGLKTQFGGGGGGGSSVVQGAELLEAVEDRLYRAASGERAVVHAVEKEGSEVKQK